MTGATKLIRLIRLIQYGRGCFPIFYIYTPPCVFYRAPLKRGQARHPLHVVHTDLVRDMTRLIYCFSLAMWSDPVSFDQTLKPDYPD
jgi:hypothetical protein